MPPKWFRREIRPGDSGPDVVTVKRILGLDYSNSWDESAAMLLRGYFGSEVITAEIAEQIGESAAEAAGLPPEWFERELRADAQGVDVDILRKILGLRPGTYDTECEAAVRRYQGNHGIIPTGLVNESLARLMGEAP
jgi:peptidoglycan hydrolase-like protein with peptidoglycan-binding domain